MKKILVLLSLLCLPVFANEKTWIYENYGGKVITTPEYVIKIVDYDVYNTILWLPCDDVVITNGGYVINLDSGEKAEIEYINYR